MGINLKESIKAIIANEEHYKNVETFAIKCFNEELKDKYNGLHDWKAYENFQIISESEIKIYYSYGAFEMEYDDSFIVKLDK
jgi:hypothetical protein